MKRLFFLLFICVLTCALARDVLSEEGKGKVKARRLFDQGVTYMQDHDYKKALDAFQGAYDASPHWMVLAHIGTCYAKLNEPVLAINVLQQFLSDGGGQIPIDERDAAYTMIDTQRKKVGTMRLIVKGDGVSATVDGESIGKSPYKPTILKAGPHHVMVFFDDGIKEKEIDVQVGQELVVRIPENEPEAAVVAPVVMPPEPETPPSSETESTLEQESDSRTDRSSYGEEESKTLPKDGPQYGVSKPFFVAVGFAGAGLIAGAIGWGAYGYYTYKENEFADVLAEPLNNEDFPTDEKDRYAGFSWKDDCLAYRTDDGSYAIPESDTLLQWYCKEERARRINEENAKTSLIPAIAGTSVLVASGGLAVLFYFHPEWFEKHANERVSAFSITPLIGPHQNGIAIKGRF